MNTSIQKYLAVGDSGEDVSHSVGSLGEGVGEVLLGVGFGAAEDSDVGSESRGELTVELAEVFLVEDEDFIGVSISFWAWVGGVEILGLVEDSGDPLLGSGDVLVGGGGVVVSQVEEGSGVSFELSQSLFGAKSRNEYFEFSEFNFNNEYR